MEPAQESYTDRRPIDNRHPLYRRREMASSPDRGAAHTGVDFRDAGKNGIPSRTGTSLPHTPGRISRPYPCDGCVFREKSALRGRTVYAADSSIAALWRTRHLVPAIRGYRVSIGRRSANNFQAAARTLNQQLIVVNARTDSDLEMAFATFFWGRRGHFNAEFDRSCDPRAVNFLDRCKTVKHEQLRSLNVIRRKRGIGGSTRQGNLAASPIDHVTLIIVPFDDAADVPNIMRQASDDEV